MAGVGMKDIKRRIKSVESTMQITKAMELVASSKLRRAKERAEQSRPFFTILYETLAQIAAGSRGFSSIYLTQRPIKKVCYLVIAGDRGLAGGYNSNIFRLAQQEMQQTGTGNSLVIPVGAKAQEYFGRRDIPILTDRFPLAEDVRMGATYELGLRLAKGYRDGEFDKLVLIYTNFVSTLSQVPTAVQLLPVPDLREGEPSKGVLTVYEPDPQSVFEEIVPQYLSGMFYGAVCESLASEHGARRTAMESANDNASEMIEQLNLQFNRARQSAITQEITEIAAGAQALE